MSIRTWLIPTGSLSSSKASQDRKLTSTPEIAVPAQQRA